MLSRGYTVEQADVEIFTGGGSVKTAGYPTFDGKSHVVNAWSDHLVNGHRSPWSSPFRVLAAELVAPEQTDLFHANL